MTQRLLVLLAALVALPLSACCGGGDYLQEADTASTYVPLVAETPDSPARPSDG